MSHHHPELTLFERLMLEALGSIVHELRAIRHELEPPTPTFIFFKESTMLDPVAGNTLVYTGILSPSGAQFSAGTSFAVTSSDPNAAASVDATGLIVTIALNAQFVDDPANPMSVTYTASGIIPNPATAPTSITATIQPTVPALTPTAITFQQTT